MSPKIKVKISSPCMAMLVYEASKSNGQAEGYLCGEMAEETMRQITDSNVTTTTEDIISIHCLKVIPNKLLAEENKQRAQCNPTVLGRFKFCRRPLLSLTVREKSNHRKLMKSVGIGEQVVTILIQESWVELQSTYTWKCVAFTVDNGRFAPVPVEIVNLKATTCGAYKPYPSIHQKERSPQMTVALTTLESSCSASTNSKSNMLHVVDATRKMSTEIIKSLDESVGRLRQTEAVLENAYKENLRLKERIEQLQNNAVKNTAKPNQIEESHDHFVEDETDSSDTEGSYGCEKATELLKDFTQSSSTPSVTQHGSIHTQNYIETQEAQKNNDPFTSLVDIAKADLTKKDTVRPVADISDSLPGSSNSKPTEEELLRQYNDERPWGERTRAGRLKPTD
uniref:Uncharacterized protein LOC100183524 n=1 Tax=Phallusia mammillata TaxID=59560 RepID=A0A6F9DH69_9ASCI|nr:uncharacterized protein LOC100183524 [Phallusia mammillata]